MQGKIEESKREVTVILYAENHQPLVTWSFRNAFPIRWSGPTLNSGDNGIAFEEIEFVHHGLDIETGGWSYLGEQGS
jgi:phage tail-like protein